MTASAETTVAARSSAQRVPEFFIAGNPKSGTTALYEMLRPHPQIFMPELGTQFFAVEQKKSPPTLEEYLSLFQAATPEQRVGEMSRGYLRSRTAASGIAELQPNAKIIVVLREPASFIRSLHLELLQDHVEIEKDLRTAIARDEAARSNGADPDRQGLMYSPERVAYVEQLRRFDALFPRENLLVLIYEEFRADNEATVKQVLRFLDVDECAPIEVKDANPTVLVRSPRLHEMTRSLYMGRGRVGGALNRAMKAILPRRLRHDALTAMRRRVLYSQPSPPDEELMLELRRRSMGEVEALSEYLGRDLVKLWGYDGVS